MATSIQTIDLSLALNKIKDQIEYDPETGGTRWPVRVLARVCGVDEDDISLIIKTAYFAGGAQGTAQYAETLDTLRLAGAGLSWLRDGIPDESAYTIIEFYASYLAEHSLRLT